MSTAPTRGSTNPSIDHDELLARLDQLNDEFQSLRKQLRHAQRLASVGTMAAMIAHEYNNLLTPVLSFARYALDQDDPDLMRSALAKTLKQAQQATELSNRILNVAAEQDEGPSSVPLRELIEDSVTSLGRDLSKDNIGLTLDVDEDLRIRAHPGQLRQVFLNLVQNARQAMLGRRGRLTIRAEQQGDQVEITLSDTGSGIRSEDLPNIFEPFFTTKSHTDRPDKRGIGLGLAVCKDIIVDHGGRIDVESRYGHGTTFTIVLPT